MLSKPKDRRVAAVLAIAGVILPISGFHKFYLRQPGWGVIYLLLSWTLIPKVASAVEGLWYLFQDSEEFAQNHGTFSWNGAQAGLAQASSAAAKRQGLEPAQVGAVADALRQLDQLRQEGLISEYEFEQKRRKLLDQIG
ncbi:NINE protein [Phormidium tenue FACHB-886]|nr:NINE protein [Phormidium tenue FACHB-886]